MDKLVLQIYLNTIILFGFTQSCSLWHFVIPFLLFYIFKSQLPLRRTPLGPAVSVRLREMPVL